MNCVPANLRLSGQRALLGAIYPQLRLVKLKLVGSTIVMTTIADAPLSEQAAEALSIAATEIISDFPNCDFTEELVISNAELPREDILAEGWVFQRAES